MPGDIRDIIFDVTNWKWSWGHAGQTGLDLIGVVPVIGVLKYTDEAADLAKVAKKASDIASMVGKIDVATLKFTKTVEKGLNELIKHGPRKGELSRPYLKNPTLVIQEIIAAGKSIPDPGGISTALRWDVSGTSQGAAGVWQLVIDTDTNTVLHFFFEPF